MPKKCHALICFFLSAGSFLAPFVTVKADPGPPALPFDKYLIDEQNAITLSPSNICKEISKLEPEALNELSPDLKAACLSKYSDSSLKSIMTTDVGQVRSGTRTLRNNCALAVGVGSQSGPTNPATFATDADLCDAILNWRQALSVNCAVSMTDIRVGNCNLMTEEIRRPCCGSAPLPNYEIVQRVPQLCLDNYPPCIPPPTATPTRTPTSAPVPRRSPTQAPVPTSR